jgi:hypothetical protein
MRSRGKPNADLETIGHPSSLLCHLGNASWRAGRTLRFDPATYTFTGDADANQFLTRIPQAVGPAEGRGVIVAFSNCKLGNLRDYPRSRNSSWPSPTAPQKPITASARQRPARGQTRWFAPKDPRFRYPRAPGRQRRRSNSPAAAFPP